MSSQQTSNEIFRIPKWLENNLPSFETHCLHLLIRYNTHTSWEKHRPFKQTGTITNFSFGYQSCIWLRLGPFCWQNPCSGRFSGINLVAVFGCFLSTLFQHRTNLLGSQDLEEPIPPYCRSNQSLSKLHWFFA